MKKVRLFLRGPMALVLVALIAITSVIPISAQGSTVNNSKVKNPINDALVVSMAAKSDGLNSLKENYDALSSSDKASLAESMTALYELIANSEDPEAFFATLPQRIQNLVLTDMEGRTATVEYHQETRAQGPEPTRGIEVVDGFYTILVKTLFQTHAYEIRYGMTWEYDSTTNKIVAGSRFFHYPDKVSGTWTVDPNLKKEYRETSDLSSVTGMAMAYAHFLMQHDYPWVLVRGYPRSSNNFTLVSKGIAGGNTWEALMQELWDYYMG